MRLAHYLKDKNINITARLASELSGFLLKDNLADTLVIPITQSGTTTDTNRAVAMAKERGAFIISIVNEGNRISPLNRTEYFTPVMDAILKCRLLPPKPFIPRLSPAMFCPFSLRSY